uniref:Uncharacterized protein n=1 Tax=Rhizophora mucronata TaxID=61149 RepID=A0A2P2PKT0_RHIMU
MYWRFSIMKMGKHVYPWI